MKRYYVKRFKDKSPDYVLHEARLQTIAAEYGIAPTVISTDYKTFIKMKHLNALSIADKYGENIDDIPTDIRKKIIDIVWMLYDTCGIQYLDVTPYNFVEANGRVWVIDFGDADSSSEFLDEYLEELFDTWELKWNEAFR